MLSNFSKCPIDRITFRNGRKRGRITEFSRPSLVSSGLPMSASGLRILTSSSSAAATPRGKIATSAISEDFQSD